MDFAWSDFQYELFESVLRFSRSLDRSEPDEVHATASFRRDAWQQCGAFGLTGLCVPEAYEGAGLGRLSTALALEAFGRGCEDHGLVFSVCAHLLACTTAIMEFASDDLKQELLGRLATGQLIGANAATEPGAGSDVTAMVCSARRDGQYYVLNGEKSYVTNGPIGDVYTVYAVTNPRFGYFGLSAFVVGRGDPGLTVGRPMRKVGLTSSPTSSLYLDDCRVPCTRLLGKEGQGGIIFATSMDWERACLFATYVGMMERVLQRVLGHAKERKQFGRPIGQFQAVAHRIVDMRLALESARLLVYRACWLCDQGKHARAEIALAKIAASEASVRLGLDAIQLHGGEGVMSDVGIDQCLRDALPSTIFSGTSEVLRNIVAAEMGLK